MDVTFVEYMRQFSNVYVIKVRLVWDIVIPRVTDFHSSAHSFTLLYPSYVG